MFLKYRNTPTTLVTYAQLAHKKKKLEAFSIMINEEKTCLCQTNI